MDAPKPRSQGGGFETRSPISRLLVDNPSLADLVTSVSGMLWGWPDRPGVVTGSTSPQPLAQVPFCVPGNRASVKVLKAVGDT